MLRILSRVLDVHQAVLAHAQSPHKSCMWCDQFYEQSVPVTVQGINSMLKGFLAMQADVADVEPSAQAEPSAAELAMLADWRSNLAALASYVASPADEALIVRLGDCLWEKQGQARLLTSPQIVMHLPHIHHAVPFHAPTKLGGLSPHVSHAK